MSQRSRSGRLSKMAQRRNRAKKMCPRHKKGPRLGQKKNQHRPMSKWPVPKSLSSFAPTQKAIKKLGLNEPRTAAEYDALPVATHGGSDQDCPFCKHYPNGRKSTILGVARRYVVQCTKCKKWFRAKLD